MGTHLSIWWHQHTRGHSIGPRTQIAAITLPWPELAAMHPTRYEWATPCAETDCGRVWIEQTRDQVLDDH